MPQSTPNLSLVTYDLTLDAGVYFSTFRSTLAGYTNSALTKIDTWAGQVNADLATLKQSPSIIRVSATKDSDFVYSATVTNMTQYSLNQYINLSLSADNVGTVSLNINALGGKSLLKFNNAGTLVNISAKDLRQGKNNLFTYNGTAWVWVNAISSDQLNIAGTSGNLVKISADNTLEDSGATFSNSVTNNAIVQRTATGQIKGAVAVANDDVVNKTYVDTIDNKIGLLSALETVDKTSVVGAINENFGHIGNLSTLTTTDKSNLVGATNELNSAIGQLSNPPININPDFKIWQRYNAGDTTTFTNPVNKYIADRYRANGTGTMKPVASGAEIVGTLNIKYILEASEFEKLNGKTSTRSWSENGVVQKETFVCNSAIIFDKTITNKILNFVKIELGEIATPLSPRPYGEELALCQRYYINRAIGRATQYGANDMYFQIPTSIRMRTNPTIGSFYIGAFLQGASQTGFNVNIHDTSYNTSIGFIATKTAHGLTDGYLIVNGLDAEIY